MSALRGPIGAIAGFLVAIVVIATCERLAITAFDVRSVTTGYMLASVAWTVGAAIAGGFVAAWIAGGCELPWSAVVGFLLIVLGVFAMRRRGNVQPGWYETAVAGCGPISAVVGGAIRMLTKPRKSERSPVAQAGARRRSA